MLEIADISEEVAKNLGLQVVLARGEQIPFKDQVFDCVLIMVAICFVDEWKSPRG